MELLNTYIFVLIILTIICLFLMLLLFFPYRKTVAENKILLERQMHQKEYLNDMSSFSDETVKILEEVKRLTSDFPTEKENTSANMMALEKQCIDDCQHLIEKVGAGNTIIDALLHHKRQKCIGSGIEFNVKMGEIPEMKMQETELVSLLGNLLDNAIEAAEKAQAPFVSISAVATKGVWSIKVSNAKSSAITPLDRNMRTTKQDATNHGMGLKIIKQIIHKHGGIINMEDSGDTFHTTVTIPVF